MRLYRSVDGVIVEADSEADSGFFDLGDADWDDLLNADDPVARLETQIARRTPIEGFSLDAVDLLPPVGSQEVWAAGVTYYRSRDARMEESKKAGGDDFYDKVYGAERPELFFKASPQRVVGHGQKVRIRADASWNVPEPELTLLVNGAGDIVGYTIGNDMSSRDIEGENPLYLPQAKVYDGSCALGPGVLLRSDPLPPSTRIGLEIERDGSTVFEDSTLWENLKRMPEELVEFLYRETSFPNGCFLMTGTGIVPPHEFTLESGDRIRISIESIGVLENEVA